jgi:hypothetical protein
MAKAISEHRLIAALVLCLSGLALLPFSPLPSRVFGWEQMAGSYDIIHVDDFEAGNFKKWVVQGPENFRMFPVSEVAEFRRSYRLDWLLVQEFGAKGVILLSGFSDDGRPVFGIDARLGDRGLELRASAADDSGIWQDSEWHPLQPDASFEVEWRRGHPVAQDGSLFLSIGGELAAWLTELDNDTLQLAAVGVTQSAARPLVLPGVTFD